jgi:pyrroline-5-carboxylate reductase
MDQRPNTPADYGVVGVGAIAEAIVAGACSGDRPPAVLLSPRSRARAAALAERFPSVCVAADNQAVVDGSSVVVLALRPQDAGAVLGELSFPEGQPVISVMAGISLDDLGGLVAPASAVARAVPLPAVGRRAGVTPIHPPSAAARSLFGPLGGVLEVPDARTFEALSASTATIAAHFEYLEAIARWLAGAGVGEREATAYVASVFAAVGDTLRDSPEDLGRLARDHATPGGINEQFATAVREAGAFDLVGRSLDAVLARLDTSFSGDDAA